MEKDYQGPQHREGAEGEDLRVQNLNQNFTNREIQLNRGAQEMRGGTTTAPAGFQAPPLTAGPAIQRAPEPGNIKAVDEERMRRDLELSKGVYNHEQVDIASGRGADATKDQALVYRNVNSMAADPNFESNAREWEMKLGGWLNTEENAVGMADKAAEFVVDYIHSRYYQAAQPMDAALATIGQGEPTFSGAVGAELEKVVNALENGSISVKMNHFQSFAEKLVPGDVETLSPDAMAAILSHTNSSTFPNEKMDEGMESVRGGGRLQKPNGIAGKQWHTRAERNPKRRGDDNYNRTKDRSERTYGQFKNETGTDFSDMEKDHMGLTNDADRLPINEGGQKWIINERDKWVKAMRDMSLPLLAGPSGTTARLMQALTQFGLNDYPALSRAAIIAYIVPNRHHSLVEVMTGAAENGGPAFEPSQRMYREIAPYTQQELFDGTGMNFPDGRGPE